MAAAIDPADLKTETLTNARGWAVVRVTHLPTSLVAERSRSPELNSPVQAQKECVDELVARVGAADAAAAGAAEAGGRNGGEAARGTGRGRGGVAARRAGAVTRDEFDALVARVAELERRLADNG